MQGEGAHVRKNWRVFIILAIIASLFVAGCGGGGESSTESGGEQSGVALKVKDVEEKIAEGKSAFESAAEAYASEPSTKTLTGLVDFAKKQEEELTALGVEAANIAAEAKEESEAEPVNEAVTKITEAQSLMEELSTQAEASLKELKAKKTDAAKYLETVTGVKEAIKALEEFYTGGEGEGGE